MTLLEFMNDEAIIEEERNWIRRLKEQRFKTGNTIYSPHLYLDTRVEKINKVLKGRKLTAADYLDLIRSS